MAIDFKLISSPVVSDDGLPVTADLRYLNNSTLTNVRSAPFNAKGNGVTDDTAAINAAITSLAATGGIVIIPPGSYRVSVAGPGVNVMINKPVTILARGATLLPDAGVTALFISQSLGALAPGCEIWGLTIDGQSRAGTDGVLVQDTDRATFHDVNIRNCRNGVQYKTYGAGNWCEQHALYDSFIYNCTTGVLFTFSTGAENSFAENSMVNVGIAGCTTGVSAAINAGNVPTLYRSRWHNLVVWMGTGQTGMALDCDVKGMTLEAGFEAQSGTPTGLVFGTNATNVDQFNAVLDFTGSFGTTVSDAFSKLPTWKQGTRKFIGTGNFASLEHYDVADTQPRLQVFGQFNGGGGIKVGPGGASVPDTTLFRSSVGGWSVNKGFSHMDVAQTLAVDGAVTFNASSGDIQKVTQQANATSSSITNPTAGQVITLEWWQDGTGGWTRAWPANCKFAGASAPVTTTTAGRADIVTFRYDGANWIETSRAVDVG